MADVAYFYGQEAPITGLFGESLAESPIGQLNGSGFDFVNEDVLLNQVRVEGGALVTRSGMRYRSLYLGGSSRRMTLPILKRIEELARAGVVVSGVRPEDSPSLADDQEEFRDIYSVTNRTSSSQVDTAKFRIKGKQPNAGMRGLAASHR